LFTFSPSRYVQVPRTPYAKILIPLHPRSTGLRSKVEGQARGSGRCIPKGQGNARLACHAGPQGELPVLEAVPQNAHGQSANIPLTTGRNQVCHCRTIRARVFAAIPLEQPVLEDVRPLRDAPLGQAYGFDSMGGDVRESAVPGFQLSGLQASKQTTCICRRKFAYHISSLDICQRGPLQKRFRVAAKTQCSSQCDSSVRPRPSSSRFAACKMHTHLSPSMQGYRMRMT
jgi:hypothetical protein